MDYKVLKGSAIGYKNVIKNKNSQDSLKYKSSKDYIICSVADGHSSDFFEYSHIGSKLACDISIDVIENEVDKNKDDLLMMLNNEIIQKKIYDKWMFEVKEDYYKTHPKAYKIEYLKYSTTLVTVAMTKRYILYLKIGDGEIIVNNDKNFLKVVPTKNNNIVDSLGREDAFKNILFHVEDINDSAIDNIILFTDGYGNSFENEINLYKSLIKTINKYNSNIFSRLKLLKEYNLYLTKLSESNSKDDISIIFLIR
ncbi:protein phosphatase 2C domain-containing protein [Romboutsia lituseburensis]|uniref:protein phosphatase 2C domain-containing protein n=1 Tax=Romboutsia lituseburensis TaxID=1537 RepID=UPI00215B07E0|nr:protein phosphatase 2C domain-containing protein [Romboutsia lituseburensis]MCR8745014.1 protein phosphatase 2C domain-containing protein [Romboutsia lituseburensis]